MSFVVNKDMFGRYCRIPTGTSGNMHTYKIVSQIDSNGYCDIPLTSTSKRTLHNQIVPVLLVIHCGVDESNVRQFDRGKDVRQFDRGKDVRQFDREIYVRQYDNQYLFGINQCRKNQIRWKRDNKRLYYKDNIPIRRLEICVERLNLGRFNMRHQRE